jgi:iron complex transport system substrate-binding protein
MRRTIAILLTTLILVFMLAGCTGTPKMSTKASETWTFTDSAGRQVELPRQIDRIAPSGSLAQIALYTLCPGKIIGLAQKYSDSQKPYIDPAVTALPVFGQFYGSSGGDLNLEAVIAAKPQVIIDIGEKKDTIVSDMDGIAEQTGLPVIFIEATLETMSRAYAVLGGVLGCAQRAAALGAYVDGVLAMAAENRAKIADADRARVLFVQDASGLFVNSAGSIHADVIDYVGAVNVARLDFVSGGKGAEVSMEQIQLWDPDVLIIAPDSIYDTVGKDVLWANITAVKRGAFYEVPALQLDGQAPVGPSRAGYFVAGKPAVSGRL